MKYLIVILFSIVFYIFGLTKGYLNIINCVHKVEKNLSYKDVHSFYGRTDISLQYYQIYVYGITMSCVLGEK